MASSVIELSNRSPRINGAQIVGFIGRPVDVVGRVTGVSAGGKFTVETSDRTVVNIVGTFSSEQCRLGQVVEVIGTVNPDRTIAEVG
jgi:hypothetical protein